MPRRRATRLVLWLSLPLLVIAGVVVFWNWDWFIPVVDSRASAALGRSVRIRHLHVRLGSPLTITADGVTIGNPPNWHGPPFATARQLVIQLHPWQYIRHHRLVIPLVALQQPHVWVAQAPDGQANYKLNLGSSSSSASTTEIGNVQITGGQVQVSLARLKARLGITVQTEGTGPQAKLVASARGLYGGAPVEGRMIGGALLGLRNAAQPWPINLTVQNGATYVSLVGSLQQPLHLKGANLQLHLAGQNMAQLAQLTGIPIPTTPPFQLTGQLNFAHQRVQFHNFAGRVGDSDLEGNIDVNPGRLRPDVVANLSSHRVDLADLGGFIGARPGHAREGAAPAEAKGKLLPDTPLGIPRLQWADVHLRYRATQIKGRSQPLDNMLVDLDIVNGNVDLHPVSFGVGTGQIRINAGLWPLANRQLRAKLAIDFDRIDVSRLMAATHMFHGVGVISGAGTLEGTGDSVAQLLGNGNGDVRLGMVGGNLSAMLVDLSGLQFGNAFLSALGMPKRTNVECMVDDMALRDGVVHVQPLLLDTGEAIVRGTGAANLKTEALDLQIRSAAKHFTIGSLPAPINIGGTLKHPSIRPGAELAVRGGLAAGLGAIFPPLAALPTIQFGVGDSHRCDRVLATEKAQPGGRHLPEPARRAQAG